MCMLLRPCNLDLLYRLLSLELLIQPRYSKEMQNFGWAGRPYPIYVEKAFA